MSALVLAYGGIRASHVDNSAAGGIKAPALHWSRTGRNPVGLQPVPLGRECFTPVAKWAQDGAPGSR